MERSELRVEVKVFAKLEVATFEGGNDLHRIMDEGCWNSNTGTAHGARQQRVRLNEIGIAGFSGDATGLKTRTEHVCLGGREIARHHRHVALILHIGGIAVFESGRLMQDKAPRARFFGRDGLSELGEAA